jgi:cyclase
MRIHGYCSITLVIVLLAAFPVLAEEIHEAARNGDLSKIQILVQEKPDLVHLKDEEGRTPLHWASRGIHLDILKFLVEHGAEINARDDGNVTPLHSLSFRGDEKAMELLIRKGADIEAKDESGLVPLIYAAYAGHEAAAAMLIKHGAKVKVRDDTGLTAVDIAQDQGHAKLARYLLSRGGELTPVADPDITKLADAVHRITFCYQQCTNMLVLDGPDGVLVIDTGYRRTAEKLKSAIDTIGKGKKISVINTHQHHDHIGGNGIADDQDDIICSANLKQLVSRGILEKSPGALKGVSGKRYEGGYLLPFNGRKIRLIPLPGTHTEDDMAVHLEDAGIVHLGDLLISQSVPSLTRGAKIIEYLAVLDKVIDIFDGRTIFVGGHGRNLSKKELMEYRSMLQQTIDIVTGGMKAGKSARLMQEAGVLNGYASYNTFIPVLNTDYWIEAVFRSYADRI